MPELAKMNYGRVVRPSVAHTIGKINEVIDYINNSDIKNTQLIESGEGESVQVDTATQLAGLTVYGKSVQDGTPTPGTPIPIQVVGEDDYVNLKIGETTAPIDLNGNVLASLPDSTRDALHVDSVGNCWIDKRVTRTSFGNLQFNMSMPSNHVFGAAFQADNLCLCSAYKQKSWEQITPDDDGFFAIGKSGTTSMIIVIDHRFTTQEAFEAANTNTLLYYGLETPHVIQLDPITPPVIPNNAVITTDDTLTPVIEVAWFTENGLPTVVNDLSEEIDEKADVTALPHIEHGITTTSGAANADRTVAVTFDRPFTDIPSVCATLRTTAPANGQVSVSGVTTTGFSIQVKYSTASDIPVHWIAVGE